MTITKIGKTNTGADDGDSVTSSENLGSHDYGGRGTDKMSPADVMREDSVVQGGSLAHGGAGSVDYKYIPGSDKQMGPRNIKTDTFPGEFVRATAAKEGSKTGVSLVTLTVDTDDHAVRLIKSLFAKKLISKVDVQEGDFYRTYLKFGKMETQLGRDRLEMMTMDEKVPALIDEINNSSPQTLAYPVPDAVVMPVQAGNPAYLNWIKETAGAKGGLVEEVLT